MKNGLVLLGLGCLVLLALGCKSTQKNKDAESLEMMVAGYMLPCGQRADEGQCMLVRKNGEHWERFGDTIEGFRHEAGMRQKIKVNVKEQTQEGMPSSKYTLLEVLDKQPDETMRLHDIWAVRNIQGEELSRNGSIPNMEINLRDMKVMGHTGCNEYHGPIQWLTSGEIRFGLLASTRKMCPDMEVPNLFKQTMPQVQGYRLEKLQLSLLDKEGNEVMRLQKVD